MLPMLVKPEGYPCCTGEQQPQDHISPLRMQEVAPGRAACAAASAPICAWETGRR